MFSQQEKDKFSEAIESLKKYKRQDIVDDKGKNLLKELYTDLLPSDYILKKSLKENTAFLIGRKGTGKSTIFLRMEQELRERKDVLPCYLDVFTIYDSSQSDYVNLDYLSEYLSPKLLKKYLIERSFLQNILVRIIKELDIRYDKKFEKIKEWFGETKAQEIKRRLNEIKIKIENNEILKEIEIPIIKSISVTQKNFNETKQVNTEKVNDSIGLEFSAEKQGLKTNFGSEVGSSFDDTNSLAFEESFTNIFQQVFQIKEYIDDIKEILKEIKINKIVLLLDDFSEIDDSAIKTFVDVVLAPLHNWSEEFINLKIAAYPNRIYYGKIPFDKVEMINLDFFNLYSEFDRNKMEEGAINFTKRLIEKRIYHYLKSTPDKFFDTSKKITIDDYYELLFQTSMNVPRIIGYILSYCYESRVIYDRPITKSDIESAAQKYYEDRVELFFHKSTYSQNSLNEKIDTLQLKDLLLKFVEKMSDIKTKITTRRILNEELIPESPYTSHFYFAPELENFLKTLELNFFISKYTEMTNRDKELSSIYCLNYGLARKFNLLWGKPKGTEFRKYFIVRIFNFNPLIKDFLLLSKSIHCINEDCNQTFTQEQIPLLEFSGYKCNLCNHPVIVESTSEKIKSELSKIKESDLLSPTELEIIMELSRADTPKFAKEIAEEADLSSYSVAQRSKLLDANKGLIKRNRENENALLTYELTDSAKTIYKKD